MSETIERLIKDNNLRTFEGERGVSNLARLCRLIGYKDPLHFGQFENGSYGDLILFLEDNPGAVEAIVDFICDHESVYDIHNDCSKCGEELYKDCMGQLRCESCDDPCPYCFDGTLDPEACTEDSEDSDKSEVLTDE